MHTKASTLRLSQWIDEQVADLEHVHDQLNDGVTAAISLGYWPDRAQAMGAWQGGGLPSTVLRTSQVFIHAHTPHASR